MTKNILRFLAVGICLLQGSPCFGTRQGPLQWRFKSDLAGRRAYDVAGIGAFREAWSSRNSELLINPIVLQREGEAFELYKQGKALADKDTPESNRKAIVKFNQALKLLRASYQRMERSVAILFEAQLLYALAESEDALGDYKNQLSHARQALALKPDDAATLVSIRVNLASALSSLGEHAEALQVETGTLEILDSPKTVIDKSAADDSRSATLGIMCVTYSYTGNRTKALDACNQALKLVDEENSRGRMALLRLIAQTYSELGQRTQALNSLKELLLLAQNSHIPAGEGDALVTMGGVLNALGDKENALATYKRALSIMQAVADPEREAQARAGMGSVYADLGLKDEALGYFRQSLQLVKATENPRFVANVLGYIGAVYESTGEYDQALKAYSTALDLARKDTIFEVNDVEAKLLLKIGSLYLSLGDNTKGVHYLTQALPVFKTLGDRESQFVVANKIADALDSLGDTKQAIEFYNKTVELGRSLEGKEAEVSTLFYTAKIQYLSGDNARAMETLGQALTVEKEIGGSSGRAKLLQSIGSIHVTAGDCEGAMKYFDEALGLEKEVGDRQGEGSTLELIGSCHEKAGKLEAALDDYQRAIAVEDKVSTGTGVNEFRSKLAGESSFAYTRSMLINLQLGRKADAFDLSERARARTFLDQLGTGQIDLRSRADRSLATKEQSLRFQLKDLGQRIKDERSRPQPQRKAAVIAPLEEQLRVKQLEYESFLNELELKNAEYGSIIGVNPLNLPAVQNILDQDTTLISFFLTDESTLVFVITRDSFDAVQLPTKLDDLLTEITRFRGFSNKSDSYPNSLKRLYSMLISPLEPYIKTRMIGIVPHSVLHYIPFAALCKNSYFFADDHTIFYLPSASVLPFVQQKRKPIGRNLLAMAQDHAVGLPVLKYGRRLAEDVARLYKTRAFTNRSATESVLRTRVSRSSIVFLAAHGKLNPVSPLFSQIVLAPDNANDGVLEVHEVYGLDLKNASLVVLTACNTALGGHTEGDDIVGLNRAFIYAGTPTVLATLWSVPEEATADLMRAFFKQLKSGKSKVEALQAAQAEVKKKNPNPYYWAAFVLTGDPGQPQKQVASPREVPVNQ